MEETCVKTIKNYNEEEISQLIVDMQMRGWRIKAMGKDSIVFARALTVYHPERR